jgi:hypothetical protein
LPLAVCNLSTYAQNAWSFLRPYFTCFDAQCINAEFIGALSSTFTRAACIAAARPGTTIHTYEPAGIASPELRAGPFAALVRASVNS